MTRIGLAALLAFLTACGGAPEPTQPPAIPTSTAPSSSPSGRVVRAGTYCDRIGATAETSTGRVMRCTAKPGEKRPRWRAP